MLPSIVRSIIESQRVLAHGRGNFVLMPNSAADSLRNLVVAVSVLLVLLVICFACTLLWDAYNTFVAILGLLCGNVKLALTALTMGARMTQVIRPLAKHVAAGIYVSPLRTTLARIALLAAFHLPMVVLVELMLIRTATVLNAMHL